MNSERSDNGSREDALLAALYVHLEEHTSTHYDAQPDPDASLARFNAWLAGNAASDRWGRVADDGTVYVRTAAGERVVGSWQAGRAEEALAFYRRQYAALEGEVALLEQRVVATGLAPDVARVSIGRLLETVATANAVGDLDSLLARLQALTEQLPNRVGEATSDRWGRVADDGTVYVRTAAGERVVGSWQAGSPDEALEFYRRKYAALETEVTLLEQRMASTDLGPAAAQASIERLLEVVATANAVGDLDWLRARLEALRKHLPTGPEEASAARAQSRVEAKAVKERIVAEAEQIAAEATHWKISGERMRQLLEEWKAAPRADRAVETALWKRMSAARNAFTKRRKAYFAGLEEEREQAKTSKEKLVVEAEALATSTDWGPTAAAYRDLMRSWKAAGRAGRADEEDLWSRFKAAQDHFFAARSEVYSAKDDSLREHAAVKTALLEEANQLVPVSDLRAARSALRSIQERWEQAGPVPRAEHDRLEQGLRRVEDAVRKAEDAQWRRSNPEALARAKGTVDQIRAAIASLEDQLAKAQERGDTRAADQATEAITARRSWLEEAEQTLDGLSR